MRKEWYDPYFAKCASLSTIGTAILIFNHDDMFANLAEINSGTGVNLEESIMG